MSLRGDFYLQSDDEPCTLIQFREGRIVLIDFTKMPGPNNVGYDWMAWHIPHLVEGAICEATMQKDNSAFGLSFTRTRCWKNVHGPVGGATARQVDALRFIREMGCVGLPQGPRPY